MTVKELIGKLKKMEPNQLVVMSKDSEGNNYSPISGIDNGRYLPTETWYGERLYDCPDVAECEHAKNEVKAVFLWPIN